MEVSPKSVQALALIHGVTRYRMPLTPTIPHHRPPITSLVTIGNSKKYIHVILKLGFIMILTVLLAEDSAIAW